MDLKDVKGWLYGWLGKQKIGNPTYNIQAGNMGRFKCELRVPGHSYVGMGNSLTKKDAGTNAALDFCNYLVRKGLMNPSEIPVLNTASLENTTAPQAPQSAGLQSFEGPQGDSDKPNVGFVPSSRDSYVTQKAEEIANSESIDLRADIHGGWTMENSKKALNEFLQKTKQPALVYNTQMRQFNGAISFVTATEVYVPQLQKKVSSQGEGSTKKVAEASCAMSIVRQLFHFGVFAAYSGERKKTSASNLPEIPLDIDITVAERVFNLVRTIGVAPAVVEETEASMERPKSLIVDCKLSHFPDSEIMPSGNISCAPPMLNWNPWRASNIDEPPLAFMTMPEISAKISEKEAAKQINPTVLEMRQDLPVFQFKDQIINCVNENSVVLIKGETGCGKSTQIAQFLLDWYISQGRGGEFNCFASQPRKISAITLAERVAYERGEQIGESVGYSVRFDSVIPRPYGAILFCTVGVLLKKMESGLRGISHIIIDEIHERDINTDFVLIIMKEIVKEYPEVRLILMSATIDTNLFTNFFGGCPIVEMHGRTHKVSAYFLEDIIEMLQFMPEEPFKKIDADVMVGMTNQNMNLVDHENPHVREALRRLNENEIPVPIIEALLLDVCAKGEPGSVLIFLPGWSEISAVMSHLLANAEFSNSSKYMILPLHSQLTGTEQRKVFNHYGPDVRKIILSTNIAETSITIDDVVFVIDSCKAREHLYTSNNNMVHFATVWASKTNLTQRKGRAGRVRPGFAFHLCSKKRFHALDEHRTPEMLRTPLHEIALTIKLLRLGSVRDFLSKAIEPPPYDMVVESEAVLQSIGALDRNLELTDMGRMLARMPIEPIMGKSILLATSLGIGTLMCELAACASFSSPFVPREKGHTRLNSGQRSFAGDRYSDHLALISVNHRYQEVCQRPLGAEADFCQRFSLSASTLKMTGVAKRQLVDILVQQCSFPPEIMNDFILSGDPESERCLDLLSSLLITAFYPNICYYRGKRKVYTLEQASALVSKSSVLTPFQGDVIALPSPLLVFSEKLRTKVISCKDLTTISAVQLLLFGCRKVECVGPDLIRLDEMITVKTNVAVASSIVALRPCIEDLLIRSCMNPAQTACPSENDIELVSLLKELSDRKYFSVSATNDSLLTEKAAEFMTVKPQRGSFHRGGGYARRGGFDRQPNNRWNSEPSNGFVPQPGNGNNLSGGLLPAPGGAYRGGWGSGDREGPIRGQFNSNRQHFTPYPRRRGGYL